MWAILLKKRRGKLLKLVLASTSPYRKSLLDRFGVSFSTVSPNVDETPLADESPEKLVCRLSEAKARAGAQGRTGSLVIGSDQVAVLDGRIIGKPGTHERAIAQLKAASGRRLAYLTGLCLYNTDKQTVQLDIIPFAVHFRQLDQEIIERYLHQDQPYNCAGSFKSESLGVTLFERMEGDDPTALMGLPLIRLNEMLLNEGVNVIHMSSEVKTH
ncbi:MAG: septum formation inhibitor Maf [Magnetococcales bacterium]|nr:septum formation inhibitor Maf [Magnetococcales bacterium]